MCVCLLSHISPLERLFVLKILSRTQRTTKIKKFVFFFQTAPFKSYGVKRKRKSQLLIRWLTRDQVFLFDVQRSTSGYCMREYKHAYCSGQYYSASSSVQSQPRQSSFSRTCLSSIRARAFKDSRTRGRRGFCTLVHSWFYNMTTRHIYHI